ncbi:MAG TPA: valine--pyruvate transaminase [Anaerolineae bacterium]|nr:valine--pyruvate transaminase [Anaerolineae bacterium]
MRLSKFGKKFTGKSGILQLMEDLGAAAKGQEMIMLGGGNPGQISAVEAHFRQRMLNILASDDEFERLIGRYGPPEGGKPLAEALAALLNREYGWAIGPENIALTNGSQTAFFYLFNLFAGEFDDGSFKKIMLPLAPEYIGYLDVGLVDDFFIASKPEFEFFDNHLFKYHVDFDAVTVTADIGAICVSRPTNPTGNVLTDLEIDKLDALARKHDIPLIIDNAYGTPFPNIIFTQVKPIWNDNIILCMSLSKLGLPGLRTGIIIANERVISAISGLNAIVSLAPGNFGAELAYELIQSGEIINLSQQAVKPFYQDKVNRVVAQLQSELAGVDFYVHKPEGAIFVWLWFKDLPITSQTLYERLKQQGVLVVPGEYFFPGLQEEWAHKYECIRVNYALDNDIVRRGISIIADEVKKAYALTPQIKTA